MSTHRRGKLSILEDELEKSFGEEKWNKVTDLSSYEIAMAAAKVTKSERTNIRLSDQDLAGIKKKAQEKGLGYQTLIASLVHQYVSGRLVEVDERGWQQVVLATVNTVLKKGMGRTTKMGTKTPRRRVG